MHNHRTIRACALAALIAAAAAAAMPASAAAPVYAGTIGSGEYSGAVDADTGPFAQASGWQFWKFSAPAFTDIRIEITPLDAALDPIVAAWFGEESDVANYFDMTSDSLTTSFMGFADGASMFAPSGAGEPAVLSFNTGGLAGTFVVAVADHELTPGGSAGMAYTMTAAVPEPETWLQMGLGGALLAGLGLRRKSRR